MFGVFAFSLSASVSLFGSVAEPQHAPIIASQQMPEAGDVQGVYVETANKTTHVVQPTTDAGDASDIAADTARQPRKSTYKIVLYGDSMVDVFGSRMAEIENALKKKYPKTVFILYNYGIGAENVDQAVERFDQPFSSSGRQYLPLPVVNPDIIIVGSYAYNPFDPYDRDRHWLGLSKLVQKAKATGADTYLLADLAPLRSEFGRGVGGPNWDNVTAYERSGQVIQQLENAVGIAKNENVLLIDAFEKSTVTNRGDGKREYISAQDNIHPSEKGRSFIGDLIANTLVLD